MLSATRTVAVVHGREFTFGVTNPPAETASGHRLLLLKPPLGLGTRGFARQPTHPSPLPHRSRASPCSPRRACRCDRQSREPPDGPSMVACRGEQSVIATTGPRPDAYLAAHPVR